MHGFLRGHGRRQTLQHLVGRRFRIGAGLGALLESIPIAALGTVKVVAVDYRQGPEHFFPAASEDVAAVYKQLLNDYRPEDIGIYGNSAGGVLAAMAVAWFQKEGLPTPGAIAIASAWKENLILEKFYAPVLDAGSPDSRWPDEQRAAVVLHEAGD